jgi:hypothetical protein
MTICGFKIRHIAYPKTGSRCNILKKRIYLDLVQLDRIAGAVNLPLLTVMKVVVRHELGHARDYAQNPDAFTGHIFAGGQSRVDAEVEAFRYGWELDHELLRVSAEDYARLANYALYHYEHDYLSKSSPWVPWDIQLKVSWQEKRA